MEAIDRILKFLDGLDCGKVMATRIRENKNTLEEKGIPEKVYNRDIKENFETFLNDYDLQDYRDELKALLAVAYYANAVYYQQSKLNQKRTKERVYSDNKDNTPLLKDLKALKNIDYSIITSQA